MSSIEEAWEEMLIPPPDVVPMWGQVEDSGDCGGFTLTKKNAPNWHVSRHGSLQMEAEMQTRADKEAPKWRVSRHGSLQLNKEKMQIKGSEPSGASLCPHPSLWVQKKTRNGKTPRQQEKEGTIFRSAMIAATLAAPICQGRGPLDPPWPTVQP